MKIILKKNIKGNEQMVYDEMKLLQQLDHPHIVSFRDWFESRVSYSPRPPGVTHYLIHGRTGTILSLSWRPVGSSSTVSANMGDSPRRTLLRSCGRF